MTKYYLQCRGCTFRVRATTRGLGEAARHDELDTCGRRTDMESEGWDLETEEV